MGGFGAKSREGKLYMDSFFFWKESVLLMELRMDFRSRRQDLSGTEPAYLNPSIPLASFHLRAQEEEEEDERTGGIELG